MVHGHQPGRDLHLRRGDLGKLHSFYQLPISTNTQGLPGSEFARVLRRTRLGALGAFASNSKMRATEERRRLALYFQGFHLLAQVRLRNAQHPRGLRALAAGFAQGELNRASLDACD